MIISNIGGGGNHLRWICLLDDKFDISGITSKDKIDFIIEDVYSDDRDWHNWLEREWRYRDVLDNHIKFGHPDKGDLEHIVDNPNIDPIIYLMNDPESCYRHYLKFNSGLNSRSKEQFLKDLSANDLVMNYVSKKNPKIKIMPAEFLFNRSLSQEKILELNDYFDINIDIDRAQVIHDKWFALNKKAEKNIITDMEKIYGQ